MPSHFIVAIALSSASVGAPLELMPDNRGTATQGDCIGKKRVLGGTVRAKRGETRRPCHVVVPILM